MKNLLLLCLSAVACGGTIASGDVTIPGQPPPPPSETVPAGTTTVTFAIDQLFLGDRARSEPAPSEAAWRSFGYDLDHKTTTKTSTDVCTLVSGAPHLYQLDGNDGIDNAWGLAVLPFLQTALSMNSPTDVVTQAIASGATTLELSVTGLPANPSASATGLSLSTSVGATVASASFDANTPWPVEAGSLARFDAAYLNHGTFVSGASASPIALKIPIVTKSTSTQPSVLVMLPLSIHDAVVTFDATTGDTVSGTIAGVLDASEAAATTRDFSLRVDQDFCTDDTGLDGIVAQIRQASDIQVDGSNKAGTTCGAISIGLGFEARRIADPTTTVEPSTTPACP